MKLETLRISDLISDPNNARKHDDKNLDAIKGSLTQFGQRKPIVIQGQTVIAGNGTMEAAKQLGWETIEVVRVPDDWSADQAKAFALADNRTAELAAWDEQVLAAQVLELKEAGFEVADFGFVEIEQLQEKAREIIEDVIPEPLAIPRASVGDVWQLGPHRVMCGDSTKPEDVAKLMNGQIAELIHADPPYGMGKEKDGVENDNLYAEKLDAFQIAWFKAFRPYVADNAGLYIWGNTEDLWRLWFEGSLKQVERMTFRNEIVWSKKGGMGIGSGSHRSYATTTERCLFIMLGEQGFNTNADNYWEGYEPLRLYLNGEREAAGLTNDQCNKICGKQNMTQSAFTKGGFRLILQEDYEKLNKATNGKYFTRKYDSLRAEYDSLRAYFDNTHDNMTDVWEFGRVYGEERHGHATPKPVEMMARVMKSSLPPNGLCVEPFGGSGSTLIGAEQTGRICYTMELTPAYVDVIIQRWENLTGQKAELVN